MDLINQVLVLIIDFLLFISLIPVIYSIIILIIFYHIIIFFIKDRIYIKAFNKYKDIETISIEDLNKIPLVTIIVPSWNEKVIFKQCLESISKLTYPKLNVIVNAGGSEETIKIAKSFENYSNFRILQQEAGGKIKAINDCFKYISEGVLYLVDADVYVTDETLLRMLIPLTNYNEDIVTGGARPLKSQENINLVKYLYMNRNLSFRRKFSRYNLNMISGADTTLKYDVIKAIGKFSENSVYSVEVSQGEDLLSKGYKFYRLTDYRGQVYTKVPDTIKIWIRQKIRWNENSIVYTYQHKKIGLVLYFSLFIISFYLLIFPFLMFFNLNFGLICIFLLFNIYLKKMRRVLFNKLTIQKEFFKKLNLMFFIKILFYIYIEALVYVYIIFEMIIFGNKKLKKRKNL